MKEYNYKDVLSMQEQAKQRVMEMQKRSKFAVDEMNREIHPNETHVNQSDRQKSSVREVGVPQQPKNIHYPVNLNGTKEKSANTSFSSHGKKNAVTENKSNHSAYTKQSQRRSDLPESLRKIFGNLSKEDSEKMLILALCLLLTSEQADDSLIMAMLYLLS